MKMLKVTVSVEHELGVVAEASFWVRDDLLAQSWSRKLGALNVVERQLSAGFWGAYLNVTQAPRDPTQVS